jgi:RNA polymerase sigma-70 factor, ECF subfamily
MALGLNTFVIIASPKHNKMFCIPQGARKTFRATLENSGARAFSKNPQVLFGRRMVAHSCRQSGGRLSGSSTEINSFALSDSRVLTSDPSAAAEKCQRIAELYDLLAPRLYAYLWYLGIRTDQAEDVIQDTFLRLVSRRFDPNRQDNLRGWIFRVARNLSMDIHRAQRRLPRRNNNEPHHVIRERIDPAPSPEQQMLLEERVKRFALLTPKQRQCVLLRAEGFRYREIAITLGVSVQRVGELMQRSIVLLEADT